MSTPCHCPDGSKNISTCPGEGLVPYHNNLGGLGPDDGYDGRPHPHPREMRYREMGQVRGTSQLIDVAVYNRSAWSVYTTKGHGCAGAFFQFKMATESEVKLDLVMEDAHNGQPVDLRTFDLSFYDFDSQFGQTEELRIGGFFEGEFAQPLGSAVTYPVVGSNIDEIECSPEDIAFVGLPCKVECSACLHPAVTSTCACCSLIQPPMAPSH